MRRRDNINEIKQMRGMLDNIRNLTLESYIMPEERDSFDDEPMEEMPREEERFEQRNDISGIEKELTQIRKIALSVINRLADQPTSQQYDTMKKIWNMVDKAIEQPKNNANYSE